MSIKILFLFFNFFLIVLNLNLFAETIVSATKIKKLSNTKISIEAKAKAFNEAIISSEIKGKVLRVLKYEGNKIEKDEIIAKIENSKYLALFNSSQEKLFSLESNLKKSSSKLKRYNGLLEKEIISNQEYEEVLYEHNSILSDFNSQLEIMKFNKINLENCNIRASFNGIISKKFINEGQYLDEGDKIFEILDNEKIEVELYIPEIYFELININDPVEINYGTENKIDSYISSIVKKIDNTFGTFLAMVYIERNNSIIPGEDLIVNIKIKSPKNSFLINKDAVINKKDKKIIYVIKNKRAIPIEIKVLDLYGEHFIANGPISASDLIVLDGNENLIPKQNVKVVKIER